MNNNQPYHPTADDIVAAIAIKLYGLMLKTHHRTDQAVELYEQMGLMSLAGTVNTARLLAQCTNAENITRRMNQTNILEVVSPADSTGSHTVFWVSLGSLLQGWKASQEEHKYFFMKAFYTYQSKMIDGLLVFDYGLKALIPTDALAERHSVMLEGKTNTVNLTWLTLLADLQARAAYEEALEPGATVYAHWKPTGLTFGRYGATAQVREIHPDRLEVELTERDRNYYPGALICLPRVSSPDWSFNNSAWPFKWTIGG